MYDSATKSNVEVKAVESVLYVSPEFSQQKEIDSLLKRIEDLQKKAELNAGYLYNKLESESNNNP